MLFLYRPENNVSHYFTRNLFTTGLHLCDIEYEKVFNKEGNRLNPIQAKKPPPTSFSPVTSTNVGISP